MTRYGKSRAAFTSNLDRRHFLRNIWQGVGAGLSLALLPGRDLRAAPRLGRNPFTLGVASGDPTPEGIVLWTRLAPQPANPTRLGNQSIPVGWRVATDERLRHVVSRGLAWAPAELAHSVHLEVDCLRPGRDHFYQVDLRGEESAVGHFRTAPGPNERPRELRLLQGLGHAPADAARSALRHQRRGSRRCRLYREVIRGGGRGTRRQTRLSRPAPGRKGHRGTAVGGTRWQTESTPRTSAWSP
jgi:hypothetical protein